MQTHICTQYENFETELCKHLRACALKPFSLHFFNPSFRARAHKPGRKIAEAASGHCHNSHTWPFGQEEVQLREFVSTLHVKPLSGPGNLAADEPHEHSESCTTPFPNCKVALASTARFCTKLHATQPLARDVVSTLLEGEGGLMMIALEGLCFTASYLGLLSAPPCLSQLPKDQQYHKTWH